MQGVGHYLLSRCVQCRWPCLSAFGHETGEMQSCLLYRLLQSKWRTHMSQSTSGPPVRALADLTSVPAQTASQPILFPFHVLAGLALHGVAAPVSLPLYEISSSLPLLLVCSPQTLPAPQPLAVPPCPGPHCTEPHEVQAYQYFDARKVKKVTVRPLEKYLTSCLLQKFGH